MVAITGYAAALQAARQTNDVDYTAVTALKLTALRMAWKGFFRT